MKILIHRCDHKNEMRILISSHTKHKHKERESEEYSFIDTITNERDVYKFTHHIRVKKNIYKSHNQKGGCL